MRTASGSGRREHGGKSRADQSPRLVVLRDVLHQDDVLLLLLLLLLRLLRLGERRWNVGSHVDEDSLRGHRSGGGDGEHPVHHARVERPAIDPRGEFRDESESPLAELGGSRGAGDAKRPVRVGFHGEGRRGHAGNRATQHGDLILTVRLGVLSRRGELRGLGGDGGGLATRITKTPSAHDAETTADASASRNSRRNDPRRLDAPVTTSASAGRSREMRMSPELNPGTLSAMVRADASASSASVESEETATISSVGAILGTMTRRTPSMHEAVMLFGSTRPEAGSRRSALTCGCESERTTRTSPPRPAGLASTVTSEARTPGTRAVTRNPRSVCVTSGWKTSAGSAVAISSPPASVRW